MDERIALDLPDGRVLDVRVSGPADGVPLLWHHGTPGCSLQTRAMAAATAERGLRLVTYSRAGAVGSTRRPGRLVADVADDMAAVADHLGVEEFLTGGASGGGPHALATGAGLPDRVLAVLAVCCVKPYVDQPDFLDGMGADNVEEFGLALQGEEALMPFLEREREAVLATDAEGVVATMASLLPDVDRAVLTSEVGEDLVTGLKSGVQELYGWLDDDLAFTRDWGFALDDLSVPSYLWQGSEDLMVPFHHGEWLAARIPGVVPHLVPGEGHLSIAVGSFGPMLDELLAHVPRS
ncbi:alpha/beta fold hydrolase [Nocardioides sp. zg-536]|uniref:Alpha/beta fold hydrolase n=1 Tax=Nocardioides faecalis TaxID=2803858 RepID=A0A939BUI3_9ACTN|nr:alpha/beta fold hydrolase [Nocardioides faecalis]MBM9458532.1 alpha/beta fold hydrolase [Nocardioides faecalis]QVI58535.1 alpha/beta fold hydrolase [Nocardioides faecalis]